MLYYFQVARVELALYRHCIYFVKKKQPFNCFYLTYNVEKCFQNNRKNTRNLEMKITHVTKMEE